MSKAVAVSFEGDQIKVIQASLKGHTLSVDRSDVLSEGDFDDYLLADKSTEYIVTCQFRGAFHDVLTTPVVKSRYLGKLIESQIRKATGEKDFSFIYTIIGEVTVEKKKALEVFYYAVRNDDVRKIAERFYERGKTVRAIYPAVFSAISLFARGEDEKGIMGVFSTGNERTAFLTKNGALNFVRTYDAYEKGLTDYDIQNINMTLTYCSQSLRISPSSILVMGDLSGPCEINTLPSVPLAGLNRAGNIECSMETYDGFFLTLSAFFASRSSNILSREFRNINLLKNYFAYASMIFIIVAVLCMGFTFNEAKDSAAIKRSVESSVGDMKDIENIYSEYTAIEEEIIKYRPSIEFLNRPAPDIYKLLIALGSVNTGDLKFNAIEARAVEDNAMAVTISGTSLAGTYSSLQSSLKNMIDTLNKTENLEVINRSVDLTKNTFAIDMSYKTE